MKNSPGCTFDEIYSTFLKNHRTYDEWRAKLEKGDTALMTHLDSLENGLSLIHISEPTRPY